MDSFFYSVVVIFTIVLAAFGVFYIAIAAYGFVRGTDAKNLPHSNSLALSRFLSGAVNLLIGVTLYWHINESTASTTLVMLTIIVFSLWEWFARAYFIERLN